MGISPFFASHDLPMTRSVDTPVADLETLDQKRERTAAILSALVSEYPDARCHLVFSTPFELLVGTILSAQCTDERVNRLTPGLFAKYPSPADFARAEPAALERDIYSTGFYRNKAKAIIACSRQIVERHGGEVPDTMEELTALEGIGRKSANVILGNAYGKPGIIVDTHIMRLSRRLGLTSSKDPVRIEKDIMELVPRESWTRFSNTVGEHGRTVCKARKPDCAGCVVRGLCPSVRLGE